MTRVSCRASRITRESPRRPSTSASCWSRAARSSESATFRTSSRFVFSLCARNARLVEPVPSRLLIRHSPPTRSPRSASNGSSSGAGSSGRSTVGVVALSGAATGGAVNSPTTSSSQSRNSPTVAKRSSGFARVASATRSFAVSDSESTTADGCSPPASASRAFSMLRVSAGASPVRIR